MVEMETAYLATGVCGKLQTEGEDKDKIINGTTQK